MLIETGTLTRQSLVGQVAVVTGAGRGIGYEAARVLVWLGARVVIAEQWGIVRGWGCCWGNVGGAARAAYVAPGSSDRRSDATRRKS